MQAFIHRHVANRIITNKRNCVFVSFPTFRLQGSLLSERFSLQTLVFFFFSRSEPNNTQLNSTVKNMKLYMPANAELHHKLFGRKISARFFVAILYTLQFSTKL